MISFELYVIEDAEDAIIAGQEELYDFIIDGSECKNCSMVLGPILSPIEDTFLACVVVASASTEPWTLCIDCAYPLLFPAELMPILFNGEFDDEEDDDDDDDYDYFDSGSDF